MKKLYSALLPILGFVLSASAQNWRPFNPDYRYHYQLGAANEITHTIFSDSTTTLPDDTVFYLNRVLSLCDTCLYLKSIYCPEFDCVFSRNAPQFMQREVHYAMGSMFAMTNPDQYVINFQAQPGESWITDALNDVIATVDSVKEVMVLSSLDSVRYISTTNDRFIEISKNHGILRYPDYTTEEDYVLLGISGLDEGERLPVMEDIFDFQAGDELVYHYSGSSPFSCWEGIKKMRFLSRTDSDNAITYEVENVSSHYEWSCMNPWDPQSSTSYGSGNSTIVYNMSDFEFLKKATPNSTLDSVNYPSFSEFGPISSSYFIPVYVVQNNTGYTLSFGETSGGYMTCGYYFTPDESTESNIVVRSFSEEGITNNSVYCGSESISYQSGRGMTHSLETDNFEFGEGYIQIGTLIDGDTTGSVPSDATILLARELPEIEVSVYPNPAHENFTVQSNTPITSIEVWDTLGKLVYDVNPATQNAEVDAKNLHAGVYVVRVKTSGGARVIRLMIE